MAALDGSRWDVECRMRHAISVDAFDAPSAWPEVRLDRALPGLMAGMPSNEALAVPGVEQVIEMPAAPMQPGRLVRGAGDVAGALRSESRRISAD
jgi:hypothetical protein